MLFNCHESFADVVSNIASALKSSIDSSSLLEVDKILKNEIFMMTSGLPIYSARSCLTNFIDNNSIVLVLSETGSGKSTCTPNFIANNLYFQGKMVASKQIIVAQPRRSATTELASRLAENRGSFVGGFVGSHIGKSRPRMNKNRTIINCVTYGILLAYARKDPFLRGYSVIVVDEVHENASDLHFLFGILKHALAHNLDLKIVLMSASVDFTKITRFFPGCQVITVEGRSFPVEECFLGGFSYNHKEYVRNAVLQCIKIHDAWTVGENSDILVFVPTKKDTAKGVELISEFAKSSAAYRNLQAFPFHSSMSEQRKKFIIKRQAIDVWNSLNRAGDRPVVDFNNEEEDWDSGNDFIMYENDNGDLVEFIPDLRKARRIIFCTNIAETSLTIPSIGYVIDCGLQYSVDHSPVMRVIDSKLVPATKVSAVQRMGRAGRLGPGKCFRLYSFEEKEALLSQTFSSPKNFDLHMLQIVEMFADIKQFQWFKEPLDSELGWTYTLLTDSGFLEHDAASEHQILTQDGQFALELDRLEIPACIALFLLRIWRCTSDTHTMIREHCITIAAFIAFGSKPFKPQYSHLHFAKAGYKQLMEYPLKDAFPNSFANVNLFDIWSNLPFHAREKFSLQFDLNFHVMQAVIELRDGLSEFMASKELFLKATAGDMNMGTLSIVPDNSQDTCYFILGHLASACFTHLGYMTETNNVMFIFDSLPEVAEIEPSEKARLAGKSPCQLVLFHSLRRETNKLNGTSKLVVGQIDPLPWVWPEKIPDRFIALYANFFPDFPG
ncbi:P-loop containing nucleoside triphosphate hydrolase protein [Chytriomyces sp. MP71]|nr:P-loop containing nucleoside triphosphate hydrolase protein [Chytriomyces sp. MP71]